MAAMPDGSGYWFSVADGGLFNYAPLRSTAAGGTGLGVGRVVGMAADGVPTYRAEADIPAMPPHLAARGRDRGVGLRLVWHPLFRQVIVTDFVLPGRGAR